MSPVENTRAFVPPPSEYILDNFEPTDRIAMLVLNRRSRRDHSAGLPARRKRQAPSFRHGCATQRRQRPRTSI